MIIKYFTTGSYEPDIATSGAAGLDLFANTVSPDGNTIGTGVHVEIPEDHVGLLIPRSSWGAKGFQLANTVGVIDSDYRGEIIIKRDPHPTKGFLQITAGDKICQLVVVPCVTRVYRCSSLDKLSSTERGSGGFGSTGG